MGNEQYQKIKKESISSVWFLNIRSLIIQIFRVLSVFLLAHWLTPHDYGIYGIINNWVTAFWFLSDLGTGSALIQSKQEPTKKLIQTCLSLHLVLNFSAVLFFQIFSSDISQFNGLDQNGEKMLLFLSLLIPFYGIRGVPRSLLERHLEFKKIASIEIVESLTLYITQIGLAHLGYGAWSLVVANATRALIGTTLYFIAWNKFFLPQFHFQEIKPLLRFALPVQGNLVLAFLGTLSIPLILGPLLSLEAIGIVTWTLSLVSFPTILEQNYFRVIFPALSKLQDKKNEFKHLASRSTEMAFLGMGWIFGLGASTCNGLLDLLFDPKWSPSKILFPLAALGAFATCMQHFFASLFFSLGKPALRFYIEALTLILSLLFGLWGTLLSEGYGYILATSLTQLATLFLTMFSLKNHIRFKTFQRLFLVLFSALVGYGVNKAFHIDDRVYYSIPLFTLIFFALMSLLDQDSKKDLYWIWRKINPFF